MRWTCLGLSSSMDSSKKDDAVQEDLVLDGFAHCPSHSPRIALPQPFSSNLGPSNSWLRTDPEVRPAPAPGDAHDRARCAHPALFRCPSRAHWFLRVCDVRRFLYRRGPHRHACRLPFGLLHRRFYHPPRRTNAGSSM